MCEFEDVLRGLPTRPSSSVIRRHPFDHLVLGQKKLVLLSFAQHMKRGWGHQQGESNSESPRTHFLPTS